MKKMIARAVLSILAAALIIGAHVCADPVMEQTPATLCILDFAEELY